MKVFLKVILFLLPLPLNAQLDAYALEKLYEFILSNYEGVGALSMEESGLILGGDTINLEVDLLDLFYSFDDRYMEGKVKVKINNKIKEPMTLHVRGKGSTKENTADDFIQNWLSNFGLCLSEYILNAGQGIKWKGYTIYVNEKGTRFERPLGFIDGSDNMHIEIIQQLEFELEEHLIDGILVIKVSATNRTHSRMNSFIKIEKGVNITVVINGQNSDDLAKELAYVNWPMDKEYIYERTYLIKNNALERKE